MSQNSVSPYKPGSNLIFTVTRATKNLVTYPIRLIHYTVRRCAFPQFKHRDAFFTHHSSSISMHCSFVSRLDSFLELLHYDIKMDNRTTAKKTKPFTPTCCLTVSNMMIIQHFPEYRQQFCEFGDCLNEDLQSDSMPNLIMSFEIHISIWYYVSYYYRD